MQRPGELDGPPKDHKALSRQLLLFRGVGGPSAGRGNPGEVLFLTGAAELQIPGALAQPVRTVCLTSRGWGRSGQTAHCACSQQAEGSDCSCFSWQLSAFQVLI